MRFQRPLKTRETEEKSSRKLYRSVAGPFASQHFAALLEPAREGAALSLSLSLYLYPSRRWRATGQTREISRRQTARGPIHSRLFADCRTHERANGRTSERPETEFDQLVGLAVGIRREWKGDEDHHRECFTCLFAQSTSPTAYLKPVCLLLVSAFRLD